MADEIKENHDSALNIEMAQEVTKRFNKLGIQTTPVIKEPSETIDSPKEENQEEQETVIPIVVPLAVPGLGSAVLNEIKDNIENTEGVEETAVPKETEPVENTVISNEPEPVAETVAQEEPEPVEEPVIQEEPEPVEEPVIQEEPEPVIEPLVQGGLESVVEGQEGTEPMAETVTQEEIDPVEGITYPEGTDAIIPEKTAEKTDNKIPEDVQHPEDPNIQEKDNVGFTNQGRHNVDPLNTNNVDPLNLNKVDPQDQNNVDPQNQNNADPQNPNNVNPQNQNNVNPQNQNNINPQNPNPTNAGPQVQNNAGPQNQNNGSSPNGPNPQTQNRNSPDSVELKDLTQRIRLSTNERGENIILVNKDITAEDVKAFFATAGYKAFKEDSNMAPVTAVQIGTNDEDDRINNPAVSFSRSTLVEILKEQPKIDKIDFRTSNFQTESNEEGSPFDAFMYLERKFTVDSVNLRKGLPSFVVNDRQVGLFENNNKCTGFSAFTDNGVIIIGDYMFKGTPLRNIVFKSFGIERNPTVHGGKEWFSGDAGFTVDSHTTTEELEKRVPHCLSLDEATEEELEDIKHQTVAAYKKAKALSDRMFLIPTELTLNELKAINSDADLNKNVKDNLLELEKYEQLKAKIDNYDNASEIDRSNVDFYSIPTEKDRTDFKTLSSSISEIREKAKVHAFIENSYNKVLTKQDKDFISEIIRDINKDTEILTSSNCSSDDIYNMVTPAPTSRNLEQYDSKGCLSKPFNKIEDIDDLIANYQNGIKNVANPRMIQLKSFIDEASNQASYPEEMVDNQKKLAEIEWKVQQTNKAIMVLEGIRDKAKKNMEDKFSHFKSVVKEDLARLVADSNYFNDEISRMENPETYKNMDTSATQVVGLHCLSTGEAGLFGRNLSFLNDTETTMMAIATKGAVFNQLEKALTDNLENRVYEICEKAKNDRITQKRIAKNKVFFGSLDENGDPVVDANGKHVNGILQYIDAVKDSANKSYSERAKAIKNMQDFMGKHLSPFTRSLILPATQFDKNGISVDTLELIAKAKVLDELSKFGFSKNLIISEGSNLERFGFMGTSDRSILEISFRNDYQRWLNTMVERENSANAYINYGRELLSRIEKEPLYSNLKIQRSQSVQDRIKNTVAALRDEWKKLQENKGGLDQKTLSMISFKMGSDIKALSDIQTKVRKAYEEKEIVQNELHNSRSYSDWLANTSPAGCKLFKGIEDFKSLHSESKENPVTGKVEKHFSVESLSPEDKTEYQKLLKLYEDFKKSIGTTLVGEGGMACTGELTWFDAKVVNPGKQAFYKAGSLEDPMVMDVKLKESDILNKTYEKAAILRGRFELGKEKAKVLAGEYASSFRFMSIPENLLWSVLAALVLASKVVAFIGTQSVNQVKKEILKIKAAEEAVLIKKEQGLITDKKSLCGGIEYDPKSGVYYVNLNTVPNAIHSEYFAGERVGISRRRIEKSMANAKKRAQMEAFISNTNAAFNRDKYNKQEQKSNLERIGRTASGYKDAGSPKGNTQKVRE